VAAEVGALLGADLVDMIRYVGDDASEPVAAWSVDGDHPQFSGIWPLEEYVHTRSPQHPLARDTEVRLASFGELVATAISNPQPARPAILPAVAEEVVRILGVDDARIIKYDADDTVTVVANFGRLAR